MPGGMNGAQLAVETRRIRPELRALLTSGYTAVALSREHGLPDNLIVLEKPYQREELANKLKLVIDGPDLLGALRARSISASESGESITPSYAIMVGSCSPQRRRSPERSGRMSRLGAYACGRFINLSLLKLEKAKVDTANPGWTGLGQRRRAAVREASFACVGLLQHCALDCNAFRWSKTCDARGGARQCGHGLGLRSRR